MPDFKGARTVTDKFSLRNLIRKHTPQNGRNYLLEAVNRTFTSPIVKERIALGEMYGYYGHGRREAHYNQTGSLRLPEFTILMIDGKPVPVNNEPSNRTLDIKLEGEIVTHTQEIFDNDPGRIVDSMERGNIGGWSWATSGPTTHVGAQVRVYEGCDYVTTPNFISINKKVAMLESAGDREAAIIQQCLERGFSDNAAVDIAQHFEQMRQQAMLEDANNLLPLAEGNILALEGQLFAVQEELASSAAMLESVKAAETARKTALGEFINHLPVFVTSTQREALSRMNTPDDMRVVTALLESVMSHSIPGQKFDRIAAPKQGKAPNNPSSSFKLPVSGKALRFE
ncbi:head processing protein [Citrobacter portucalensis]|uniref:head processing protein n=1 Tax=Citrobacter portucalensis TaxID=1639133 RepID=UPI00226BB7C5|nr:head processing protein [Citrobacter portucalensis]MCX8979180.1 head processing protein [Citrobacter portucalensis]